jgi:hypothetical protein
VSAVTTPERAAAAITRAREQLKTRGVWNPVFCDVSHYQTGVRLGHIVCDVYADGSGGNFWTFFPKDDTRHSRNRRKLAEVLPKWAEREGILGEFVTNQELCP